MPKFFDAVHPIHNFSRRSLFFSLLFSFVMVFFFNNWQKIMFVVTVFQLISCIAVPIAFTKLRKDESETLRLFKMPFGKTVSFLIYLLLTFLLIQAGTAALVTALILHIGFFIIYVTSRYQRDVEKMLRSFMSSWTIFCYLAFTALFGYFQDIHILQKPITLIFFFGLAIIIYFALLGQRDYQKNNVTSVT